MSEPLTLTDELAQRLRARLVPVEVVTAAALSHVNLPEHPRRWAVAEALDILEPQAVAVVLGALDPIIQRIARAVAESGAVPALTAPVTAAAIDELSQILHLWGVAVDDEVLPFYRKIFQAGGYSALAQITAGGDPASIVNLPADYLAEPASRFLATVKRRFDWIGEQAWTKARTVMLEGMDRGQGIDVIAENIRGVTELTKAQATTLARTHVVAAANAGAYDQAFYMPPETRPRFKQWLATLDRRTRPTHVEADGNVVPLDDPFYVGHGILEYPGDVYGPDEEVVNCRCTLLFTDNPDGEFDERTSGRQQGGEGGVLQKVAKADVDLIDVDKIDPELREAATALNEFRAMPRPMFRPGELAPTDAVRTYEEARMRVGQALDDVIRTRIGPAPQVPPDPGLWTDWGDVEGSRAWRARMADWLPLSNDYKRWIVYYQGEMRQTLTELGIEFAGPKDLALRATSTEALDNAMRRASMRLPRSWLSHMNRKPVYALDISNGRGHYNPSTNILAIRPNDPMLAQHELMHHAEATVPGLSEAQWYLKWLRETEARAGTARLWDSMEPYHEWATNELVRPDGWPDRYMGKTYHPSGIGEYSPTPFTHYEVLSTSSEAWFGDPFSERWRPYHTETWEQLGMRWFMLSVLATVR